MNIVHVLSSLGVGGQERVALDLATLAVQDGHPTSVISLDAEPGGPLANEFENSGVCVLHCPRKEGPDPTLLVRMGKLLRSMHPDIVHTHNPLPLVYGAPPARFLRAKVIHTKHGLNPASERSLQIRRMAARCVHAFVAVSTETAEQARAAREHRDVIVISNGIRLENYVYSADTRARIRNELGIPDSAVVVGTVGRLDESKNQLMLIEAMKPYLSKRVHLVITGDGPTRSQVEHAAQEAGAPHGSVHVTGRRSDVAHVLNAFDLFCLPSKSEGLPLVVPEAMAVGLPVICTNVGGLPSVVNESFGKLVSCDMESLRNAISDFLSRSDLTILANAARAESKRFSAERMWQDYKSIYQRT